MPEEEAAHLRHVYADSRVILEYGSGGSTKLAASMPNKLIMSVESDQQWARKMREELAGEVSPAILHYVNIGPVGRWGRPVSDVKWRRFHTYPISVWDQPWFRQPDTVLIDGRFRTACFAAVLLKTKKPVRILFDDYGVREKYRIVETIMRPDRLIGRMAEFSVGKRAYSQSDISVLISQFFEVTLVGDGEDAYRLNHLPSL
jgi:hypothetical protein